MPNPSPVKRQCVESPVAKQVPSQPSSSNSRWRLLQVKNGFKLFVVKMGCSQVEVGFAADRIHLRYITTPLPPSELWGEGDELLDLLWAEKHLHLPTVDEIIIPIPTPIQTDSHFIQKDERDEFVLYHIPFKGEEVSWI